MASTPGSTVLAVDDVILGAMAASSGTVPNFTSDARKALGTAIGEAEKTGVGTLIVDAAPTTTTLASSGSPATYGDPVNLTATVLPTPVGLSPRPIRSTIRPP